ncbi:hypothetical protein ANCDUO_11553 [Ancylostoma duodenale]|uniref:Uncharacterized protein n=1 Tax=Ancylostoma duodenale TaxID=51022 RepID=A0A0C2CNF3_9BILA|nr:hypothetical protein ANCDUO_11553 [Ancylostoma duodenale]
MPRQPPRDENQQLQLMNSINTMVKNGQFTSQLANVIFALCAQLKTSGINLEQTHRSKLSLSGCNNRQLSVTQSKHFRRTQQSVCLSSPGVLPRQRTVRDAMQAEDYGAGRTSCHALEEQLGT